MAVYLPNLQEQRVFKLLLSMCDMTKIALLFHGICKTQLHVIKWLRGVHPEFIINGFEDYSVLLQAHSCLTEITDLSHLKFVSPSAETLLFFVFGIIYEFKD